MSEPRFGEYGYISPEDRQRDADAELGRLVRAMRPGDLITRTLGRKWISRNIGSTPFTSETPEEALRAAGVE